MVILQEFLDDVRDVLSTRITNGQAGTDTTLPNKTDTGLGTAVAATKIALTYTKATNPAVINFTHVISTTLGNGSALTEWELLTSADVSVNRTVTAPLNKTSAIAVTRIVILEINDE